MNKRAVSLWGFVGTVILTTLMAGSQGLGFSRINFPYMLGTMFTPNRDRAKLIGFGIHFLKAGSSLPSTLRPSRAGAGRPGG